MLLFRLLIPLLISQFGIASVERHKRQLLKALNLSSRPPALSQPPSVELPNDLFGGSIEKITLETIQKSWTCLTPEAIIADCFEYSLNPIHEKVVSASLILDSLSTSSNFSVMIYEVDELFGELHFLDSFEPKDSVQVTFDVTSQLQNWIRRRQTVKMIKIELVGRSPSNLRLHDSMLSPPHFEVTVFRPNREPHNSECHGCCVVPFYVNFTEIGWNDWILSPPGFYANFCAGTCSADETYQFMKTSALEPSMIPTPSCVPSYYGSVDFVVALGPRDIRKTRVHGMRALACSCS